MKTNFGQDFLEFYYDENWGTKDYPIGVKETIEALYPQAHAGGVAPTSAIKATEDQVQAGPVATVQETSGIQLAGIFQKIPAWGWILIGLGAVYLITGRRR